MRNLPNPGQAASLSALYQTKRNSGTPIHDDMTARVCQSCLSVATGLRPIQLVEKIQHSKPTSEDPCLTLPEHLTLSMAVPIGENRYSRRRERF